MDGKTHALAALCLSMMLLAGPALAADYTAGDITIAQPWARATAGVAKNGAA